MFLRKWFLRVNLFFLDSFMTFLRVYLSNIFWSLERIYRNPNFKYLCLEFGFATVFILSIPCAENNPYILHIPNNTAVVAMFDENRSLEKEYQILSKVYFKAGEYSFPSEYGTYPLSLIDRVEFGPERKTGIPQKDGTLTAKWTVFGTLQSIGYTYEQDIDFEGKTFHLKWDFININIFTGNLEKDRLVLEEPYLSKGIYMIGQWEDQEDWIRYASETYSIFPPYLLDVQLESGQSVKLYYRWWMPMAASGPAKLVYADVDILEGTAKQTDYWKLVYSALHHNWDEKFWVFFDRPLEGAYGIAVLRRNAYPGETPQVYTLDANLKPLRQIAIEKMTWSKIDTIPYPSSVWGWDRY